MKTLGRKAFTRFSAIMFALVLVGMLPLETMQGQQVLFSRSIPLYAEGYEDEADPAFSRFEAYVGFVVTPLLRPTGLSLRLTITILPLLNQVYYVEFANKCSTCNVKIMTRDNVTVGSKTINTDIWNLNDGPYVNELIMTLNVTNIDVYLSVNLSSLILFKGISSAGHVADLEIGVYDMSLQTTMRTTARSSTTISQATTTSFSNNSTNSNIYIQPDQCKSAGLCAVCNIVRGNNSGERNACNDLHDDQKKTRSIVGCIGTQTQKAAAFFRIERAPICSRRREWT